MRFSIMLWGDYETSNKTYELLLDAARFADEQRFTAITIPERHFHTFGGHYPNPSVLGAAVAALTTHVGIRANSVVAPFHNPIRIAEEWSAIDVLSGGRVELSLTSGWQPDDFVMCPYEDGYRRRKEIMWENGDVVRTLWRGGTVEALNGVGQTISVNSYPRPVQSDLHLWATAAGNPATFEEAGKKGYSILTALLGQTFEELEDKIKLYRSTEHGKTGRIALMLHTFVGQSEEEVEYKTRAVFRSFLWKAADLTLPASVRDQLKSVPPDIANEMLDIAFERYYHTASLIGTLGHCQRIVDRVRAMDVDEICCLIDFGLKEEDITKALPALAELKQHCS